MLHQIIISFLLLFLTTCTSQPFTGPVTPTTTNMRRLCDIADRARGEKTNIKTKPISHLCHLNITFVRQSDCSASITEVMILPYSLPGGMPVRRISRLSAQSIRDIKLKVITGESPGNLKVQQIDDSREYQEYNFSTPDSSVPVALKLEYTLTNAVYKYSRACGASIDPDHLPEGSIAQQLKLNLIRYRFQDWPLEIANSSFAVNSTDPRAFLQISRAVDEIESFEGYKRISSGKVVSDSIYEESFIEAKVDYCPHDLQCFADPLPVTKIVFIVVAVVIIVIFLMCIVVCRVRSKKGFGYRRSRNRPHVQLPDEFNADSSQPDDNDDPPSTSSTQK